MLWEYEDEISYLIGMHGIEPTQVSLQPAFLCASTTRAIASLQEMQMALLPNDVSSLFRMSLRQNCPLVILHNKTSRIRRNWDLRTAMRTIPTCKPYKQYGLSSLCKSMVRIRDEHNIRQAGSAVLGLIKRQRKITTWVPCLHCQETWSQNTVPI